MTEMARRPKLEGVEKKLGKKFPILLCGLLNEFGMEKTAELLGIAVSTLRFYLWKHNVTKMWVVLDDRTAEFTEIPEGFEDFRYGT